MLICASATHVVLAQQYIEACVARTTVWQTDQRSEDVFWITQHHALRVKFISAIANASVPPEMVHIGTTKFQDLDIVQTLYSCNRVICPRAL